MKRIVFTLASGSLKFARCGLGLGRSLKLIGDKVERVVVTDQASHPWATTFSQVLEPRDPIEWIYFSKLSALDRTDADQILYIDSDCLAFKRLPEIFDYCQGKGLCVQGNQAVSGEWYGSIEDHLQRHRVKFLPKFNGGLIYYERMDECQRFLTLIREMGKRASELGFTRDDPLIPDEPIISLAMAQTGLGHLIPDEADFTNTGAGLIGKLTLDVQNNDCHYVCRRDEVRFVRPHIFHASRYINFRVYWKQLGYLEKLEHYESLHEFGYMSYPHRLRRSVERRYLKLRGKL